MSRAVSRAKSAARDLRLQQRVGHPLTLPAEMVIDGKHDRYCVSAKMHLQSGRILYQCKRQHDRFAILDGVEVPYGQFGEAFCSDTAETAISILDQYRFTVRQN